MKKAAAILALFLVPATGLASTGWYVRDVEVVSVSSGWDGSNIIQIYFRANISEMDTQSLSCAGTWESGVTANGDVKSVAWKSSSPPSNSVLARVDVARTAHALGAHIDIFVNNSSCYNEGHDFDGVRITIPD